MVGIDRQRRSAVPASCRPQRRPRGLEQIAQHDAPGSLVGLDADEQRASIELWASFEVQRSQGLPTWTGTVAATKRVNAGEVYDLFFIGSSKIDQVIAAGKLASDSRVAFAKSGVNVAFRAVGIVSEP